MQARVPERLKSVPVRQALLVRTRPRPVGVASMHRVHAALKEFCDFEVKHTTRLARNPVYAYKLSPEVTPEGKRWTVVQTRTFLTATKGDPLGLLFRIVLLRGAARRSACAGQTPTWTPGTWKSSTRS